jgi:hypothetical protein
MSKIANPRRLFIFIILIDAISLIIFLIFYFAKLEADPGDWIAVPIVFGSLIFAGVIIWLAFRPMIREQAILKKGEHAEATLLDYWDTGTTINDNPQVGMRLEVRPSRLAAYQADTKTVISRLDLAMLHKGAVVEVTYLPDDPQEVAFVAFTASQEQPFESGTNDDRLAHSDLMKGRLAELDELRLQHMITETDYQRRRDQLLKSPPTVV